MATSTPAQRPRRPSTMPTITTCLRMRTGCRWTRSSPTSSTRSITCTHWFSSASFDEAARNAQGNNFGRGGVGNDSIYAEAQDYSGSNKNANMFTPPDGQRPRMRMFLWTSSASLARVDAPAAGMKNSNTAEFGPQAFERHGRSGGGGTHHQSRRPHHDRRLHAVHQRRRRRRQDRAHRPRRVHLRGEGEERPRTPAPRPCSS